MQGLALSSALPQTWVCLTQQPPSHREVSCRSGTEKDNKAEGRRVPGDGDCPSSLPSSVQQYCACKHDAMLLVTCPSGHSQMSLEIGDKLGCSQAEG